MPPGRYEGAEESSDIMIKDTMMTQGRQDQEGDSLNVLYSAQPSHENTQESLAEPELLALIIELRLRAGRTTSSKDKVKSNGSNGSSKSSTSAIDTLDLCHRKIEKLPFEMVNIIKDDVVRLALGYNLITSLPSNFIDLSQLRYLNVRANLMNTFPSVLCTLPSLEILDISRNKIRKLPSEPGRLLELRVLSISNNRLRKLPVWLYRLKELRILKLEGNPISWPPPHISVMPPLDKESMESIERETEKDAAAIVRKKVEDRQMALYITTVKAWIEENKDRSKGADQEESWHQKKTPEEGQDVVLSSDVGKGENLVQYPPAEVIQSQVPNDSKRDIGATLLSIQDEVQSEDEKDTGDGVNGMSLKETQSGQMQSAKESRSAQLNNVIEELQGRDDTGVHIEMPNKLSPEQTQTVDEHDRRSQVASSLALQQATQSAVDASKMAMNSPGLPLHHGRNNSLSTVQSSSSLLATNAGSMATTLRRSIVRNKKSLPDLRQNIGFVGSDRIEIGEGGSSLNYDAAQRRKGSSGNAVRRPPLPQTSSESTALTLNAQGTSGDAWPSNTIDDSEDHAATTTTTNTNEDNKSATLIASNVDQMHPTEAGAVEVERNSYFRRLSTLPASSISKSISIPILQCVDATRGVLYALSQMHSALKQYITFASDERMTSQLSRALDIASRTMSGLIDSLDRFDSLSRIKGGSLNPMIVRGVLTSCSESVNTFRKIISLLQLQLKSLQNGADIRYTRTLLLLLYGSLAEVHHSWMVMEPLFKDVLPYLQGHEEVVSLPPSASVTVSNLSVGGPYTLPSIAEATSPISPKNARSGIAQTRPLRRRHAGSFSAQDVAQGAFMIPSVPLPTQGFEEIRKAQRPAALGPFPISSRAGMYQVQQGDIDGGDLLDSAQLTPMAPLTPKEMPRKIQEDKSRRTLSNTSGVNLSAKTNFQAASNQLEGAVVDDHLVLLLVKITSIAYSVWANINDHLNTLGIPPTGKGMTTTKLYKSSNIRHTTPDNTPLSDGENFTDSPHTLVKASRMDAASSSSIVAMRDEHMDTENGTILLSSQAVQISPTILSKLSNLRESIGLIVEQTNRLESCCDRIQEKSGIKSPTMDHYSSNHSNSNTSEPTFHDVFIESSSFIKSILQISHFIKSLSVHHHHFPRSIKVVLAQLTTCARDLTLHLHFLGGGPLSSASSQSMAPNSSMILISPTQQHQRDGRD